MPRRKDKDGLYRREDSSYWWASYINASGKRTRRFTGTADPKEAEALQAKRKIGAYRCGNGMKLHLSASRKLSWNYSGNMARSEVQMTDSLMEGVSSIWLNTMVYKAQKMMAKDSRKELKLSAPEDIAQLIPVTQFITMKQAGERLGVSGDHYV